MSGSDHTLRSEMVSRKFGQNEGDPTTKATNSHNQAPIEEEKGSHRISPKTLEKAGQALGKLLSSGLRGTLIKDQQSSRHTPASKPNQIDRKPSPVFCPLQLRGGLPFLSASGRQENPQTDSTANCVMFADLRLSDKDLGVCLCPQTLAQSLAGGMANNDLKN
ncbi:hypothetical protein E5288_WYG006099 [Bos mutus]|uniref:Uncharacterized protein n=1 Tax=Bos mutus TaxID=72004 RepID=A0A6B0S000_9CETA|nr:hypothetical protein [Bos mutus]